MAKQAFTHGPGISSKTAPGRKKLSVLLQVADLGMQLLEAKQVSGVLPVLRLAGSVSEEPHLQFLKVSCTLLLPPASKSATCLAWTSADPGTLCRAMTMPGGPVWVYEERSSSIKAKDTLPLLAIHLSAEVVGTGCRDMLPWTS